METQVPASRGYTIKQTPDDFIVEEVSDRGALRDTGEYAIIEAEKEGLNTQSCVRILADAFSKREQDIAYAGLKDKRAKTTQLFSVAKASAHAIAAFSHPQLRLKLLGFQDEALYLGSHTHNKFTITIQIDTLGARIAYDQGAARTAAHPALVNYFGEQRFSANNAEVGLAIVRKDFAQACAQIAGMGLREAQPMKDWLAGHPTDPVGALMRMPHDLLQLFLHAFQSRIWNHALSRYIAGNFPSTSTRTAASSQGPLAFPDDATSMLGIQVPHAGFGMERDARFDAIIAGELAQAGISERDFIIRQIPRISCEGGVRAAAVPILDFSHEELSETRVRLSFSLPKGSYATTLLAQIFGE